MRNKRRRLIQANRSVLLTVESLNINWYTVSNFPRLRHRLSDYRVHVGLSCVPILTFNSTKQRRIVKLLMISSGYRIVNGCSNYYTRIIRIEFQNNLLGGLQMRVDFLGNQFSIQPTGVRTVCNRYQNRQKPEYHLTFFEFHGPSVSAPEWIDVGIAKARHVRSELRLLTVTKRVESVKRHLLFQ